jgi:hypothetical protein
VHKDEPTGIFDLSERSMRYAAGFCFFVGFLASVLVASGSLLRENIFRSRISGGQEPTPRAGEKKLQHLFAFAGNCGNVQPVKCYWRLISI